MSRWARLKRWLDREVEIPRSLWLAAVLLLADGAFPNPIRGAMNAAAGVLMGYVMVDVARDVWRERRRAKAIRDIRRFLKNGMTIHPTAHPTDQHTWSTFTRITYNGKPLRDFRACGCGALALAEENPQWQDNLRA